MKERVSARLQPYDPEWITIEAFVKQVAATLPPGVTVLDAGAGESPYRRYFAHTRYVAADFALSALHAYRCLDVVTDLGAPALADNSFDVILCNQVLEHVPDPARVIREFARVLKPNGQLFMTVPQSWEVHEAPYDFFRYTRYGMEVLFQQAGLTTVLVEPRGGYFVFMAERVRHIIRYLPGFTAKEGIWRTPGLRTLVYVTAARWLPMLIMPLDRLDHAKTETLGYSCIARK